MLMELFKVSFFLTILLCYMSRNKLFFKFVRTLTSIINYYCVYSYIVLVILYE
jgi:hypothetical protein